MRKSHQLSFLVPFLSLAVGASAVGCSSEPDADPNDSVVDGGDGDDPGGINLNTGGTPVDSDGDGVVDGIDTNGDGVADHSGTAIDNDNDGKFDGIDVDGDGMIDYFFATTSGGGPGKVMGCNDLQVEFETVVPTVLLLVDRSSSMFDQPLAPFANRWEPLKEALIGADGAVTTLQGGVRFGFAAYTHQSANGVGACPLFDTTEIALSNFDAIKSRYDAVSSDPRTGDITTKGETPTGAAITAAANQLEAFAEPGPKFILLVTDGEPDTCATPDPQCGQDESIAAAQAAYAKGIGTFTIGVGEIGQAHLQDLANAGSGQPVLDRPEPVDCLMGSFTSGAYSTEGGTAKVFNPANPDSLKADIASIVGSVRSCVYTMNEKVVLEKANLGSVFINDQTAVYDDPNGWRMNSETELEILGTSCQAVKTTINPDVFISFPCDVFVK